VKQQGSVYDQSSEDDVERIVVKVWQDVLGVDQISSDHNFFELGGNSLTALRMLSQLENAFGKQLPSSLFKEPTVKQLVDFIITKAGILP